MICAGKYMKMDCRDGMCELLYDIFHVRTFLGRIYGN